MKKTGFTLIELLIVITVLGVVSIIAIASLRGVQERGRDHVRKRDLVNITIGLETYHQRFGKYISGEGNCAIDTPNLYNSSTGVAPYLEDNAVPQDPSGTNYCYISDPEGTSYQLCSKLENSSDPSIQSTACGSLDYNYSVTPNN